MCVVSSHVNARVHHYRGRQPHSNRALQAFVAAQLLRDHVLGIDTITKAAVCTGVCRSYVKAALVVLQSENTDLAIDVLKGRDTLLEAAKKVRNRAQLIESFKAATPEDRIALGRAVGVGTLFDTMIVPAL